MSLLVLFYYENEKKEIEKKRKFIQDLIQLSINLDGDWKNLFSQIKVADYFLKNFPWEGGELDLLDKDLNLVFDPLQSGQINDQSYQIKFDQNWKEFVLKQTSEKNQFQEWNGYEFILMKVPSSPYFLIFFKETPDLFTYSIKPVLVFILFSFALIGILLFITNYSVHKEFVKPSRELAFFIEREKVKENIDIPKVPGTWKLYFETIAEVFASNRSLVRDMNDLLQYLEQRVEERTKEITMISKKNEELLLNILPFEIAEELKQNGNVKPIFYESATILFTDFKDFTSIAENLKPNQLIENLDYCFKYFDQLMDLCHLEKLKTIGDSYMCVGGVPKINKSHPVDAVLAGLKMQKFIKELIKSDNFQTNIQWNLRIGIHTGHLVAGVIGDKKFTFDVWGDTVNLASRMESSGLVGTVNVSEETKSRISQFFECNHRGKIDAKNKGQLEMFTVVGLLPQWQKEGDSIEPNQSFWEEYKNSYENN
jgi:class 3 adenylate cyclase